MVFWHDTVHFGIDIQQPPVASFLKVTEDRGSGLLRNTGTDLPNHTASSPTFIVISFQHIQDIQNSDTNRGPQKLFSNNAVI
jgi:hypothetical protein